MIILIYCLLPEIYEQSQCVYSVLILFNIVAWLVGAKLMNYEYMRRLSEAYYAHWVYWTLMFVNNLTFIILKFNYDKWYLIALQTISLLSSFGLCLMMIITKRRTIRNPRPDLLEGQGLIGSSDDLVMDKKDV